MRGLCGVEGGMKCWVLWWKYGDGSGQGLERVYLANPDEVEEAEKRARLDLELVQKTASDMNWHLTEVPVVYP